MTTFQLLESNIPPSHLRRQEATIEVLANLEMNTSRSLYSGIMFPLQLVFQGANLAILLTRSYDNMFEVACSVVTTFHVLLIPQWSTLNHFRTGQGPLRSNSKPCFVR